jgi:hypothetical protein
LHYLFIGGQAREEITMPNNTLQPLELVGNERKEFDRVVCGRKPAGRGCGQLPSLLNHMTVARSELKQQNKLGGAVVCNSPLSPGVAER